jgi:hypothetical protein
MLQWSKYSGLVPGYHAASDKLSALMLSQLSSWSRAGSTASLLANECLTY